MAERRKVKKVLAALKGFELTNIPVRLWITDIDKVKRYLKAATDEQAG